MQPQSASFQEFRRFMLVVCAAGLLAVLPAWGQTQTQTQTLTVGTDSSLLKAMSEVARGFEATRPGLRVLLVAGEPGALLAQMANPESATRFDVLAGVDAETAALGVQRRLLRAEVRSAFAANALVLVVPASGTAPVQRLADLARPEVQRIATGRVSAVPLGRYAREAINAQRLWPAVQRKLVQADSGAEVLALVQQGDVDAGFAYASDAAAAGARIRVVETLPTVTAIRYGAFVAAASGQAALAADFLAYLRSEAARAVWQGAGLALP